MQVIINYLYINYLIIKLNKVGKKVSFVFVKQENRSQNMRKFL